MHMRTSMNIPKELLKEAADAAGVKTQTMAVILGLQELIRKKKLEKMASLIGSGAIKLSQKDLQKMRRR